MPGQETTMAPGLRPLLAVLCLGQVFAFWFISGQYSPGTAPAADKAAEKPIKFITGGDRLVGGFWGNDGGKKVIAWDGTGVDDRGTAIAIRFDGPGWRGCGYNWKGLYPADAADDVSRYRSLVLHVRQDTAVADADLTVHLVDNHKRAEKKPASNGLSVLKDGRLSRIDGEWRKVVLPLERFARGTPLDLKRVWGIDFSDASGRALAFQIDRIGFSDDCPPLPRFPPTAGYSATATVQVGKPGHTIPDQIYGACELSPEQVKAYGNKALRWGGNRSSRFNWKVNADNAGRDWFFKNGGHKLGDPADGGWVKFLRQNQEVGATGYLTVPILGFVAKDYDSYAFSVKKYGPQQATEMGHPDVGNGITPDGKPIRGNDWRDTSVEATPEFMAEGVRLVVKHAKPRAKPAC